MGDGRRRADFWRDGQRSWLCFGGRSLWSGGERRGLDGFWFDGLGLDRHGWGWWHLWGRGRGKNWRSHGHRSGRHNWRGCLRLGWRLNCYGRRDHGRVRGDMGNGDGLRML